MYVHEGNQTISKIYFTQSIRVQEQNGKNFVKIPIQLRMWTKKKFQYRIWKKALTKQAFGILKQTGLLFQLNFNVRNKVSVPGF